MFCMLAYCCAAVTVVVMKKMKIRYRDHFDLSEVMFPSIINYFTKAKIMLLCILDCYTFDLSFFAFSRKNCSFSLLVQKYFFRHYNCRYIMQ